MTVRVCLVVIAGAAALVGCDGSREPSQRSAAVSVTTEATSTGAADRKSSGTKTNRRKSPGRSVHLRGYPQTGRTKTTASGAIVILPRRPTGTLAQAGRRCTVKVQRQGDSTRRYFLPPSPGITARRLSDAKVLVAYQVFTVDRRCRTTNLTLTIDVNDDPRAGVSTVVSVRRARGTVTIDIPPDLANADVIRATARTRQGYPSEAASVLIR